MRPIAPSLAAMTYDDRDDIVVIGLAGAGGGREDLEHIVYRPRKIAVASGKDSTMVFDIEDAEGTRTLLSLAPTA